MKVLIYPGSLQLVRKSGVGQAMFHQKHMLEAAGVPVTYKKREKYDIVHYNTIFPDSFFSALKAKIRGKKIVYYGHSTMEDFRNSFIGSNFFAPAFKCWIKLCYSLGDVIITPSEYSKALLTSYGIKKPIYAISNGVDSAFFSYKKEHRTAFRKKYGIDEDKKVVISVGHYIERKGITDFIEMARQMPEYLFFWFGYTDKRLIPAYIQQAINTAPKNLFFPGFVEQPQLRQAYCGSDLFAFMSYEETEGIVVLEAMSCGIPVLVRNIPVYEKWLIDGKNCYKAENNTVFKRKIKAVLEGKATDVSEGAKKTVEQRSYRVLGQKLTEIYGKI